MAAKGPRLGGAERPGGVLRRGFTSALRDNANQSPLGWTLRPPLRLQYFSKTQDDSGVVTSTAWDAATGSKQLTLNALRPQLARRQIVTQIHSIRFETRHPPHSTRSNLRSSR